jgi:hypothetical protein
MNNQLNFSTLKKFYGNEIVDAFLKTIIHTQTKARIEVFLKYHTEELLTSWISLFPPPSIYEIWIRWVDLPEHQQSVYINTPNKRIKLS